MKQLLLISILLPLCAAAQPTIEVRPVLSGDYQAMINNDTAGRSRLQLTDSSNSMRTAPLRFTDPTFSGQFTVRRIGIGKNNTITLYPTSTRYLYIGGSASLSAELLQHNQTPATQKEYAQGRSSGGTLVWYGPDTGEPFSYGPALSTLSFDGIPYIYDNNGQLIPGSGIAPYNNSILRNGSLLSHALTLHARYKKDYYKLITASLKAGQSRQQTIITTNKNKADNISGFLSGTLNKFSFSSHYDYRQERFTHNNRNGFLNRAYQASLLTPASFSNSQGTMLAEVRQRSYSPDADNPLFLLEDESHAFVQRQQTAHLTAEYRINKFRARLAQSFEQLRQHSHEGYRPGTAFLLPGAPVNRIANDKNYNLNANLSFQNIYLGQHFRAQTYANYIYTTGNSAIRYASNNAPYHYQRSSHDLSMSFAPEYNGSINYDTYVNSTLILTGKFYGSNTSNYDRFLLPSVGGNINFSEPFHLEYTTVKFFGSYNRFNSELPVNRSFAYSNLLQYNIADAMAYLPLTEVTSYNGVDPIKHKEAQAGIELSYKAKYSLSATWFSRHTTDDLFPVMNGNTMDLVNIASHRNKGFELELRLDPNNYNQHKVRFSNTISLVSYRSTVTDVAAGYNYTPIAGFKEVHKAIVKDQPLGVIIGNSWLRDANNNMIIGNDGYPLVNNTPTIIGNPIPDFILKMSHRIAHKEKLSLNIDWEWQKGGDRWNGTQALLDYYGRSANSASLRNTTGYVFNGVMQNGRHNTIPVSFYDPSQPVEQNRWVRYGHSGVAESYIQKADCIRLHTVSLSYKPKIKKYIQDLTFTLYAGNIVLWSAYKGADPNQLLHDEPVSAGLDLFNMPSVRSFGFNVSFQF